MDTSDVGEFVGTKLGISVVLFVIDKDVIDAIFVSNVGT